MGIVNIIKTNLSKFLGIKNSMSLPNTFLKYGNRGKQMLPDWTEVVMNDFDHYTGYGYAAIKIRSNMVARTALANVRTDTTKKKFTHPYLETIHKSKSFTDYQFWGDISTFLDLEGAYYLMAVRAVSPERVGKVQEFKMLNPYNIRRVMDPNKLEVAGYVETRGGFVREIPKEMIIEIRELNPFSDDKPMAMTDAAKEAQFTLKTSGDYTRNALKGNINAPGIMSNDVALEAEEFQKFTDRVKAHTKGEPIFGNGQGAITWESMQVELSKAALKDINEINRDSLFAVSGVSKTIMGIEQSGTTRETSRVQKELIVENQILPRIQLIIDALNQDYDNNYGKGMDIDQIIVDNPLGVDMDDRDKEVDVEVKELDLYQSLINKGIDNDTASKYVNGEVGLDSLKIKKSDPVIIPPKEEKKESLACTCEHDYEEVFNQIGGGVIQQQQASLQNAIINIDSQLLMSALNRLPSKIKNELSDEGDLITKTDKNNTVRDLSLILTGFYGVVMSLIGKETAKDRSRQYTMPSNFSLDRFVKSYIKETVAKVSESHVDTVSKDIFKIAQEGALDGLSLPQIESLLKTEFTNKMTELRAKVIARTETNRAFTRAQFEADKQFIEQNELTAYKKWITRSSNPCPFCQELASEPAVPFQMNFRSVGSAVKVGDKEYEVEFEDLEAGNAHPNCSCAYELIIK